MHNRTNWDLCALVRRGKIGKKNRRIGAMEIILFSTPRQFLEENHSYLATHEVTAYQSILSALAQKDNLCSAELLFGKVVEQNLSLIHILSSPL